MEKRDLEYKKELILKLKKDFGHFVLPEIQEQVKLIWDRIDNESGIKKETHFKEGIKSINFFATIAERIILENTLLLGLTTRALKYDKRTNAPICDTKSMNTIIFFQFYLASMTVTFCGFSSAKLEQIARKNAFDLIKFQKKVEEYKKYENAWLNKSVDRQKNIYKKNGQNHGGMKPEYKSESQLHTDIKKIEGWENLSHERISEELGFNKSWLRNFLNSPKRCWNLPAGHQSLKHS